MNDLYFVSALAITLHHRADLEMRICLGDISGGGIMEYSGRVVAGNSAIVIDRYVTVYSDSVNSTV